MTLIDCFLKVQGSEKHCSAQGLGAEGPAHTITKYVKVTSTTAKRDVGQVK